MTRYCTICGAATKNGYYPQPDGKGKFQHEQCKEDKQQYIDRKYINT